MFNKDFYPTSVKVLDMMGIDCHGKVVLEPSAGKGNIIDYLFDNGASQVLACEINPDLATITRSKANVFIAADFLTVTREQVSHINMIVMNPPFSADEKHIMHAWEIAPDGCEIIALCNWETIDNAYTSARARLNKTINQFGSITNLGSAFSTSERTTDVEIGLVRLFKPISASTSDFSEFFMDEEPEEKGGFGIMPYNAVRDIVQRYINAVREYSAFDAAAQKMNSLVSSFEGMPSFNYAVRSKHDFNEGQEVGADQFAVLLQKAAWKTVFNRMNLDKYVTSGVKEKLNKFCEQQQKIPFTVKNVWRMVEIIVGTMEQNLNEALVNAVDNYTRHTHENRYGVEGWKTNSCHLLNRKFIVGWIFELKWGGGVSVRYSGAQLDALDDLVKVMCSITGVQYDTIGRAWGMFYDPEPGKPAPKTGVPRPGWGEKFEWAFFTIRAYKKGTAHFEFKNPDHWAALNQKYAKIKGFALPEKMYQKPKRKSKANADQPSM